MYVFQASSRWCRRTSTTLPTSSQPPSARGYSSSRVSCRPSTKKPVVAVLEMGQTYHWSKFILLCDSYSSKLRIYCFSSSLSLADILPEEKLRGRQSSLSESDHAANGGGGGNAPKRVQHLSETSDAGSTDSSNCDLFAEECEVLQEMFPESSLIEVGLVLVK